MAKVPLQHTGKSATHNAYQQHILNSQLYGSHRPSLTSQTEHKTDVDFLKKEFRFLRNESEAHISEESDPDAWAKRMAIFYEEKLFKEFALCDLSRYKHGKIGLRWRSKREVLSGKGELCCANITPVPLKSENPHHYGGGSSSSSTASTIGSGDIAERGSVFSGVGRSPSMASFGRQSKPNPPVVLQCNERAGLHTLEVPFHYVENGETKSCLVKLRVCPSCAKKVKKARKLAAAEKNASNPTAAKNDDPAGDDKNRKRKHHHHKKSRHKKKRKSSKHSKKDKGRRESVSSSASRSSSPSSSSSSRSGGDSASRSSSSSTSSSSS